MKKFYLLLFAFLISVSGYTQQVSIYDMDNVGIHDNSISCIKEIDGYLWIGNAHGCSRFDGETWKHYSYTDMGAEYNYIWVYDMLKGDDGNIWACGNAGVFKFDGEDWTLYESGVDLKYYNLLDMEKDSKGNLWFVGSNGVYSYFYKLDTYGMKWTLYDKAKFGTKIKRVLNTITIGENDEISFLSSKKGFVKFDGTDLIETPAITSFNVAIDKDNYTWSGSFGDPEGLVKYDKDYKIVKQYKKDNSAIPFEYVGRIGYNKEEETVWFASSASVMTAAGIMSFDEKKEFFLLFGTFSGLPHNKVSRMFFKGEKAYLGTDYNGVVEIDFNKTPYLDVDHGVVTVNVVEGTTVSVPMNIINKGGGTLDYKVVLSNAAPWLGVVGGNGSVNAGDKVKQNLVYDAMTLKQGDKFETKFRIESNGGYGFIRVVMNVVANPGLQPPGELNAEKQGELNHYKLTWTKSTDTESGLTPVAYKIFRDNKMVAEVSELTYVDKIGNSAATYEYYVTAIYDNPNYETAASEKISVTTTAISKPSPVISYNNEATISAGKGVVIKDVTESIPAATARMWKITPDTYEFASGSESSESINVIFREPGDYAIELIVTNAVGAGTSIESITVSNKVFEAPVNLKVDFDNKTRNISAVWEKPSDISGITSYKVYRDNSEVSEVSELLFKEILENADATYKYHVTAVYSDPDGESEASNVVTIKTVKGTTSVDGSENIDVSVYPNPNNGTFRLKMNNGDNGKWYLIDVNGKVVQSDITTSDITTINVDKSGVYLLKVEVGNSTKIVKIVVR
ncbi:MAG: T9SS type A sorting domain-containing protein [Bacteroidales bacterium]|jgi:hypothetical protein|nr:T9SS type A sorting domain-containing protein [Bacteroidales bacterium]